MFEIEEGEEDGEIEEDLNENEKNPTGTAVGSGPKFQQNVNSSLFY